MKPVLIQLRDILVSLKLTIVLLALSLLLVFAATLDQVNLGIWAVQEKYFHSFVIFGRLGNWAVPLFPGGYSIGGLLLGNLIAAHVYRFAFTWKKAGIIATHAGLILLLIGELLSGWWQQEYHMRIAVGQTKTYAESFRLNELAVMDVTDASYDDVVAIPESLLQHKTVVQHPKLPFRVVPKTYYPNAELAVRPADADDAGPAATRRATAGFGRQVAVAPVPMTDRPDERNQPAAIVEFVAADGSLGSYLVSTQFQAAQEFSYGGRTWRIALRSKRTYQPFALTLLKFSHDRYAGTDIPKNFSSRLHLRTPGGRDDRDVLISMNNPLRYGGLTFYQAGFENDDRTTILQVVRNPSWVIPYVACAMMTLGLAFHFAAHLFAFLRRRRTGRVVRATAPEVNPTRELTAV